MTTHGQFTTIDGRPALHFERRLPHPIEQAWAAVTDPAELKHWFPAEVSYEQRVGATMTFVFPDAPDVPATEGSVLEFSPPRRFVFTWGEDELRVELSSAGDGTLLRFTHAFAEADRASRDAAGWHVCLDELSTRLDGGAAAAPGMEETPEHRALYDEYVERGLPSGAPMPSSS